MKTPSIELQGVGERALGARFLIAGTLASLAFAGGGANTANAADSEGAPKQSDGWELEWTTDFNSNDLPDRYDVRILAPNEDSQEYSIKDNVEVKDDKLILSVTRHCLKRPDATVNDGNKNSEVCPDGYKTVYASGRVETLPILTGDYKVEVRARLADMEGQGKRVAIWVKNTASYSCDDDRTFVAESDILEWYSAEPEVSTATTHLVCEKSEINSSFHKADVGTDWQEGWHTFVLEVVDNTYTYFIDGQAVKIVNKDDWIDNKNNFPTLTNPQYFRATGEPQLLVLNTEGFNDRNAESKAFRAPDPAQPFPEQEAEFDWVRVYKKK